MKYILLFIPFAFIHSIHVIWYFKKWDKSIKQYVKDIDDYEPPMDAH